MATIRIAMTGSSEAVLEEHAERGPALIAALRGAIRQAAFECESYLTVNYLRGGDPFTKRGGQPPLAVRSGGLLASIRSGLDGDYSAWFGTTAPAGKYGKVQLGPGKTTITPTSAKYLWIPLRDNMTASGVAKMSPREAMSVLDAKGHRALRFISKGAGLFAFLPGDVTRDKATGKSTATPAIFKRGPRKGEEKGKLLFRLVKSVTIQGTDALAKTIEAKRPRILQLLQEAIDTGQSPSGVTA